MEKDIGEWDEIYRNARKAEKLRFETNERDEGELERTGQPVCIYEVYNGAGAWPFLHHGSLYRGLSLVSSCCLFSVFQFLTVSFLFYWSLCTEKLNEVFKNTMIYVIHIG